MELEIYFCTQVCVHNNLSKWTIGKSLYLAIGCKKKHHMDVLILRAWNPIHTTFLCMHKEHLSTISSYCRNMEPHFL